MRRLFALLALLSGLAAVGAPANAVLLGGAAEQVASAEASQAEKQKQGECRSDRRDDTGKAESKTSSPVQEPIAVYLPTVYFGADRALE